MPFLSVVYDPLSVDSFWTTWTAVLLDEFLKAQTNERKNIAEENQSLEDVATLHGPLDPLLHQLSFFRSRLGAKSQSRQVPCFEVETALPHGSHAAVMICLRGFRAFSTPSKVLQKAPSTPTAASLWGN